MYRLLYFFLLLGTLFTSCKKFVTVDAPAISLADKAVFSDSATAEAAVLGLYHRCMQNNLSYFNGFGTLLSGLCSDELIVTNTVPNIIDFYTYSIQPTSTQIATIWTDSYQLIYRANAAIEGLSSHTDNSRPVFRRLKGEAHFMRALVYFELLQLFGPVPLPLTTDYRINATLPRSSVNDVLGKVVADLQQADELLPISYYAKNGRVRPNRYAAQALLSRAYLFGKDWSKVITAADIVMAASNLYKLAEHPTDVFEVSNAEAIWQLMPILPGYNTGYSQILLGGSGLPTYATLRASFLENYEEGDLRRLAWISTHSHLGKEFHQPNKYRYRTPVDGKEFMVMLRLGEIVLNRAEAKAEMGDLAGATEDINLIRERSGLPLLGNMPKEALLNAIFHERQIELSFEQSHRWFDLKRTGKAAAILSALKPDNWKNTAVYWPIPQNEINANPTIYQNEGY